MSVFAPEKPTGKPSNLLWLILGAAWLIKFPVFFRPLLGYFSSYQVTNAMMAEMMLSHFPAAVFMPQTWFIMNGWPALHLVYYPFGALFAAAFKAVLGGGVDFWGHFQAALCVFAAAVFLYKIARHFFNAQIALLSVFLFSFSPMVLLSGISLQNEAAALLFLTASFWLFLKNPRSAAGHLLSGILFSLCLAGRLHFMFVIPAFLWAGAAEKRSAGAWLVWLAGVLIPVTGFFLWTYRVSLQYPDRLMSTLFMQAGEGRILKDSLLFAPDFYARIAKILLGQWLTPVVLPFFLAGFLFGIFRYPALSLWLAGSFAALVLLPQKVYDHPFYLISGLPAGAMLAAECLDSILNRFKAHRTLFVFLVILVLGFSLRLFLVPAFSTDDSARIPDIGRQVRELTVPGALVIAEHDTNPDLLYYCGRMGWSFDLDMAGQPLSNQPRHLKMKQEGYGDPAVWFEKLLKEGADYLVISQPAKFRALTDFSARIEKEFQKIDTGTDDFLIFDLKQAET